MDPLILHNERIFPLSEAGISPASAGLLYGWGIFATLRITASRAFAFERYWERLEHHAARAKIIVPVIAEEASKSLARLIEANSVTRGRARITILKGKAGAWRQESDRESHLLIFTAEEKETAQREVALTLSPYRLLATGPLAGIKSTAMLENLLALEEARSRRFDDAVMLNERGEIVSSTSANIFWSEGDELITPSQATGCVAGITRHFICEIARRLRINLVEGSFPVQRLRSAREVFLTSTARRIVSVAGFDITNYQSSRASMTRILANEYQKLLQM